MRGNRSELSRPGVTSYLFIPRVVWGLTINPDGDGDARTVAIYSFYSLILSACFVMRPLIKNTFFVILVNISFSYHNVLGQAMWR